jgi:hypothetical protein
MGTANHAVYVAILIAVLLLAVLASAKLPGLGQLIPKHVERFSPKLDTDTGSVLMDYTCGVQLPDGKLHLLDSVTELQSVVPGKPNTCVVKKMSYEDGLLRGNGTSGCTKSSALNDKSVVSDVRVEGGRCIVQLATHQNQRAYAAYEEKLRTAAIENSNVWHEKTAALANTIRYIEIRAGELASVNSSIRASRKVQDDLARELGSLEAEQRSLELLKTDATRTRQMHKSERDALVDQAARLKKDILDLQAEAARYDAQYTRDAADHKRMASEFDAEVKTFADENRAYVDLLQEINGYKSQTTQRRTSYRTRRQDMDAADRPCPSAKQQYRNKWPEKVGDADPWDHYQTSGKTDPQVLADGGWPSCDPLGELDQSSVGVPPAAGQKTALVTLHEHCGKKGWSVDLNEAGEWDLDRLRGKGFEVQNLSSVSVKPGWRVRLYMTPDCRGEALTADKDVDCLTGKWNDMVQSLKITQVPAFAGDQLQASPALRSNYCIQVDGDPEQSGSPVNMSGCTGGLNQQWLYDPASKAFKNASGMCLDVWGASKENHAKVKQYRCHGGQNQQFNLVGVPGDTQGLVVFKPEHTMNTNQGGSAEHLRGKCLDVAFANKFDGAELVLHDCNGGANQQFRGNDKWGVPKPVSRPTRTFPDGIEIRTRFNQGKHPWRFMSGSLIGIDSGEQLRLTIEHQKDDIYLIKSGASVVHHHMGLLKLATTMFNRYWKFVDTRDSGFNIVDTNGWWISYAGDGMMRVSGNPADAATLEVGPPSQAPQPRGTLYKGVDFPGNDIRSFKANSQEECVNTCTATPSCTTAAYENWGANGGCWLKSDARDPRKSASMTTWVKDGTMDTGRASAAQAMASA